LGIVVSALVGALASSAAGGAAPAPCHGEHLSFEQLARKRGVHPRDVDGLRQVGFTLSSLCSVRAVNLATALRKMKRPKPQFPAEYLRWRQLSLVDENGAIDPDGLMRAKSHVDRMRASKSPLADGISRASWSTHGPGNVGGRIRALVIDPAAPDTMFIGSVSGGIWKTTNGGTSWTPVDDFMANLAVSSIVVQPGAPAVMYAGTGEGFYNADGIRGAGIFKSTDGGMTWSQLAATSTSPSAGLLASDFYYVNRVAISPDASTLLTATRTGIFRSTNGGASFTRATMVGGAPVVPGNGVMDLDFHPSDSARAVAGRHNGTALYTTDGGATWASAAGMPGFVPGSFGNRVETAFAPSDGAIVYASIDVESGSMYKSTNGGISYVEVFDGAETFLNPLSGQGWYDNMVWVSPTDPNLVVWGGIDLFRSTDGAASFSRMSQWFNQNLSNPTSAHADQHVAAAHPGYDGTTNRTVFFGNDGGVYRASDVLTVGGGASPYQAGWSELNNGLAITQFYGAAGHPATGRVTAGTQDNGTLFFDPALSSASENWTDPFGGDGGFSAYDSADGNYFYGEYVYAQIHRNSTAGSFPSAYIYSGLTDAGSGTNAEFIAAFVLDPSENNRMLVAAVRLWRTNNVKAVSPAWETIKPALSGASDKISAIGVAPGNPDIIYAGHNSGQLYKTTNGTAAAAAVQASWTTIDNNGVSNPLPNRRITRITIDRNDPDVVYVTFGGFSGNNVYKSVNGGATWADITGPAGGAAALPDVPVRDLEIHPTNSNWIYAGTEVGVFASDDAGATWSLPHDGPSNVSVDELFFLNTTLYAASHGRGLFSTPTAGPFTDSTLSGVPIKVIHVAELRSYINGLRTARGLETFSFTDPVLTPQSTFVRAIHVAEMRAALDEVYIAGGRPAPSYTDATLTVGATSIRAVHLEELRAYALGAP
jgi:photosystem II stability/assembly factor-like uncharacterized protein